MGAWSAIAPHIELSFCLYSDPEPKSKKMWSYLLREKKGGREWKCKDMSIARWLLKAFSVSVCACANVSQEEYKELKFTPVDVPTSPL